MKSKSKEMELDTVVSLCWETSDDKQDSHQDQSGSESTTGAGEILFDGTIFNV